MYGPSDARITLYEEIASRYKWDYLRVPFYTVPRVRVKNAQELFDLLCTMECYGLVFRGQTSEYYLNRSSELMEKLYGEENAKEPSLASLALRSGDFFETHYTEWALLIKEYLSLFIGSDETSAMIGQMDVGNFYMFCLAVDAFHQETIPLDTVMFFAECAIHSGIPVKLQPAWLVSTENQNAYNVKTKEIIRAFEPLHIPLNQGNVIFPSGNALKYLREYFDDNAVPFSPYEENPEDIKTISVDANGDVLNGNVYKTDILEIIKAYRP